MLNKIIKPIAFVAILSIILFLTYNVLRWKDTTGDYQSVTTQLYGTKDNLIDVVFLGSSHCYTNINPVILWDEYGYSAFDMSISGQDKDSTYYCLKELLKTQTPSVVCVDMYGLLFDEHEVEGNVYRNMLSLKTGKNSIDLVNAYVDEEDQGDFILRWPIIHTRYAELDKYDFTSYPVNEFGRGEGISFADGNGYFPEEAYYCNDIGELSQRNLDWIDSLYELSLEYDFNLVFFMAPFAATVEEQMTVNALASYAEGMGVPFLDFNKLSAVIGYNYGEDATDHLHSNAGGAAKITTYFGQMLSTNYDLADHRGDDNYYQWDLDSKYYQQRVQENTLNRSESTEEFIINLLAMNDVIAIISLDGIYEYSMDKLSMFSIPEDMYSNGGKWIYEDGVITFVMDNDSKEEYLLDVSKYDTFVIRNSEDTGENIMLGNTSLMQSYNGLNIVVYDKFQEKVIAVWGE